MILTQTAQYAIRAMSQLALLEGEDRVASEELSALTAIPVPYLSKVMRKLVVASLATSKRGHHGGFALGASAADITILAILQAVDEPIDAGHCVFGWAACDSENPCLAHHVWRDAKERLVDWASTHTLADIRGEALQRLAAAQVRP